MGRPYPIIAIALLIPDLTCPGIATLRVNRLQSLLALAMVFSIHIKVIIEGLL